MALLLRRAPATARASGTRTACRLPGARLVVMQMLLLGRLTSMHVLACKC